VKCRTEAVNNLLRPLETCKMLKIILSKRKLIKISESVVPHETLFQRQLGFAKHLTWNVTNVTFIFATSPNTKLKEKNVGGHSVLYPSRLKKWGGHVPHLIAPTMVILPLLGLVISTDHYTWIFFYCCNAMCSLFVKIDLFRFLFRMVETTLPRIKVSLAGRNAS